MPIIRRVGRPGLLGMAARTAVVAGTATATSGAIRRRQMNKEQEAYDSQQYEAQQQQAQAAAAQQSSAPQQPAGGDLLGQLERLGQLRSSGVLSEEEFTAAKAKLLG